MSASIPIIGSYDLIVAGGGLAGVAAALSAEGSCYIAAPESYLGGDFCASPVIPAGGARGNDPLVAKFFDEPGSPLAFPLRVKALIEEELEAAGVVFELGAAPIALLEDGEGALAGVVFSGKCGAYAVLGRMVFDASPSATLARLAGAKFTDWDASAAAKATRITIGPEEAGAFEGVATEKLGTLTIRDARGKDNTWTAFRHVLGVEIPDATPGAAARAEQKVRAATWSKLSVWQAPRTVHVPGDCIAGGPFLWGGADYVDLGAFKSSVEGLYVAGPCAALARQDAAKLLSIPEAVEVGRRLAGIVCPGAPVDFETLRFAGGQEPFELRCEPARETWRADTRALEFRAWPKVPEFGDYDVVVVGGGTGGAPAALAAARAGARVLLLEAQGDLGGIGTLGAISVYWYGNKDGFTAEVTKGMADLVGEMPYRESWANPATHWNALVKAEWFRREIEKAGGEIWHGALVTGALQAGETVAGVTVATERGFGCVRAKVVVDATGSADVAYAAGCECTKIGISTLAMQGCGLPQAPVPPTYNNTDYVFINDNDLADVTRAMVLARRRYAGNFDLSPLPGTRERRQIVGDVTVTPLDVLLDRTWEDAVCRNVSDFDSHGYTLHPVFHVVPPRRGYAYSADLPLRALMPRGYSGLLVTGLGISGDRDAMPIFRMQADIQNHAYAAGLAAAMAAKKDGRVRRIDISALQRKLVEAGMLPPRALASFDAPEIPQNVLVAVASGPLSELVEISALMTNPSAARPLLRQRLADETDAATRLRIAKLLAALGDDSGASILIDFILESPWDKGWNYTGMGQGGESESEVDSCIQCLALAHAGAARRAVVTKARQLVKDPAFSHIRAVASFASTFRDAEIGEALAETLRLPAILGGDFKTVAQEFEATPASKTDTSVRNRSLCELCLARAVYLCGDTKDHLAEGVLRRYVADVRGYFSRYAATALAVRA